jgi:beta-lactamase regulating signal transducer with metallopeptidase domain
MNPLVQRMGWMLIHSVWEDILIWSVLHIALLLLVKKSPQSRYLASCLALVAMAVLPWVTFGAADLSARLQESHSISGQRGAPTLSLSEIHPTSSDQISSKQTVWTPNPLDRSQDAPVDLSPLLPFLVAAWIGGLVLSSVRLWMRWRNVSVLIRQPLRSLDATWRKRFDQLVQLSGVDRIIRLGETAAVSVPIVAGWLKPVILLPLGVLTSLPAEQIETILLHELAHVSRHDYLINLLQNIVETVFFYHPAVWSVSRRIRLERELACDDQTIQWCKSPRTYAEALAGFEEFRHQSPLLAATGEGDLFNRIRRILIGPELEMRGVTLFAVAGFCGIGLYLASMILVPLVAAELMTDKERVAKIEALQPPPNPGNSFAPPENVFVTGTLTTEDGKPLPKGLFDGQQTLKQSEAQVTSSHGPVWSGGALMLGDPKTHIYYGNTQAGRIELGVWAEGYAPLRKTILQAQGGQIKADLTLKQGFPARVQVIESNGEPLAGVTLTATSSRAGQPLEVSMPPVKTDTTGNASFGNVEADSEIHLNAFKSGWQMADQTVSQWTNQTPFVCKMEPAQSTSGVVIDQATHRPIAGVEIILAARRGAGDSYVTFDPKNGQVLGHTDEDGNFNLESLSRNPGYYIYVQADGYPIQSFPIFYGQHDRVCELPRGLHLRGKILDPKGILESKKYYHPIELEVSSDIHATPFNSYGQDKRLILPKLGPEIPFEFDNLIPGRTDISFAIFGLESYEYEINLQKNVDDYVIDLGAGAPADSRAAPDPRPLRTLEISLKTDSGAVPTGVLDGDYLSSQGDEKWSTPKTATIVQGTATMIMPVPTKVSLYADHLVGYWFAPQTFDLPTGTGIVQRTINAVRAGVIHGNISPSPEFENQSLSILPIVIKSPPGLTITDLTSGSFNSLSSRNDYVTQPLPFGGVYAVVLNAAPSYFISAPALVDAEHPIAVRDLDLKLPAGAIKGQFVDETKKPISYQEIFLTYHPDENDSFASHSATTDADGGFTISGVNFAVPGNYEVQIYGNDWAPTKIRIDGHTPQPVIISVHHLAK